MDLCLKEIIHNFTTNELLFYLDNLNLQLDQEDLEILKRSKISGPNFLHLNKEDLLRINLEFGPAITLSVFISKINAGTVQQEELIPCIMRMKWPYSEYFKKCSFKDWAFDHFKRWCASNDRCCASNDNINHTIFINKIREIKNNPGTLKEISDVLANIIHSDIDPISSLLSGNISPFIKGILKYYGTKSFREFYDFNESAFQTAVEMLIHPEHRVSEMQLVKNGNKNKSCYGFPDIFVVGENERGFKSSVVLELKYLSLKGLLGGEDNKLVENSNYNELKELNDKICDEPEETLFRRKYYFWCKNDKKYKLTSVVKIIDLGVDQLKNYIKVIKKGQCAVNNYKIGVLDERINIELENSILGGWLLVSLGSRRIIMRKIEFKKVDYRFTIINK
ncbi:unnamed protein product [Rhizophagus irregularis]|nr:unnamed protein product [Rhizophagus irregularis]CAB5355582.1 unnamed protein product [Rhizophagus irregularis]